MTQCHFRRFAHAAMQLPDEAAPLPCVAMHNVPARYHAYARFHGTVALSAPPRQTLFIAVQSDQDRWRSEAAPNLVSHKPKITRAAPRYTGIPERIMTTPASCWSPLALRPQAAVSV